jgi:hypothetical protein
MSNQKEINMGDLSFVQSAVSLMYARQINLAFKKGEDEVKKWTDMMELFFQSTFEDQIKFGTKMIEGTYGDVEAQMMRIQFKNEYDLPI